ncbi:MAG: hypothetical protein SGJ02_09960 [bacterium]|nr:hypothetical protein [bacterium]
MTTIQDTKKLQPIDPENDDPNETGWNISMMTLGIGVIVILSIVVPYLYFR